MPRTIKQEIFSAHEDALSTLAAAFPEAVKDGEVDWDALKEILADAPSTGQEKYELTWAGKDEAKREAGRDVVGRTLRFCPEESKDAETTQNLYIEGDNLEVLKLMRDCYYGSIKLIYIDPPYNTGNDFIYVDSFKQNYFDSEVAEGNMSQHGERLVRNPQSSNRYHADWLSMIYPRLRIARDFLSQDGLIAISIDDNELANLKKCCDEVFGERNFISQITILSNPRGRQSETFVASVHEYLLLYSRNIDECRIFGEELSENQISEYSIIDSSGEKYRLLGLRQRGVAWRREDRPAMHFPIYVNPENGKCSLSQNDSFSVKVLPVRPDGQEGPWKWGTTRVQKDIELLEGRIIAGRGEWDISVKDYLNKSSGELRTRKIKTLWDEKELNYQNGTEEIKKLFDGETVFPYAKPLSLLQRIVSFATDEDSIILEAVS